MPAFVLCDVFAERPFAGNQLAVFLDVGALRDEAMLALAQEFGWSEITFVLPARESAAARVRIWTPHGELPFAGHPTVGTAVVLAATGRAEVGWNTLEVSGGPVAVEITRADQAGGRATMTQGPPDFGPVVSDRAGVAAALGLEAEDLAPDLPAQVVSTGLPHFLVPVRSLAALGRATPDPVRFAALGAELGIRWAYLFSVETPGDAAAARARLLGVGAEDVATGSAAGPLGAYLVRYGLHRAGAMDVEQGIEMGRPSRISVDVPQVGGEIGAVRVSGDVVIWGHGETSDGGTDGRRPAIPYPLV